MILGQVGKNGPGKRHAVHALLLYGVGGGLHHSHVRPGSGHLRQHGVHMQGVGRSQRGWFRVAGPAVVNGAHNAHFVPGFAEQPFQQIGAGGLAIGAGDAQDLQRQRIGVPAGLSQPPKGLARVRMGHHSAAPGYGSGRIGPADHSSRAAATAAEIKRAPSSLAPARPRRRLRARPDANPRALPRRRVGTVPARPQNPVPYPFFSFVTAADPAPATAVEAARSNSTILLRMRILKILRSHSGA